MHKFTGSPWKIIFNEGHAEIYPKDNTKTSICTVGTIRASTRSKEERIANTNLIKTAPKLYHVLEEILEYTSKLNIDDKYIKRVLAEARGEHNE